jgi:hypothetical protein
MINFIKLLFGLFLGIALFIAFFGMTITGLLNKFSTWANKLGRKLVKHRA